MDTQDQDDRPVTTISDADVERRVLAALLKQNVPSLLYIHVEVKDDHVTLSGKVRSFRAKALAHQTATEVRGVWRVINQVEIAPAPVIENAGGNRSPALAWAIGLAATIGFVLMAACWQRGEPRETVFPVEGVILADGRKFEGAAVTFYPRNAPPLARRPAGRVGPDGTFRLTTYEAGDGAPIGQYVVTVELRTMVRDGDEFRLGPNVLPAKYASPKTTVLQALVVEGPNRLPQWKIVR